MNKFKDQVVLITGASAGIGAALALEYGCQGANLILLARRQEKLNEVAQKIDPTGKRVLCIACDVTKDELTVAVQLAQQKFGKINIAIANAGWALRGNLADLSLDDYRSQWETNVFGALRTIYATLDDLKTTKGSLVVISSVKSYIALAGDSPYSMGKFALRGLCQSLSAELAADGVSVSHICPAYVATEIRQVDNQGVFHPDWRDTISPTLVKSADVTARQIIKAVEQRKSEKILTVYGKLLVQLQRHTPWLVSWLISSFKLKVNANHGQS